MAITYYKDGDGNVVEQKTRVVTIDEYNGLKAQRANLIKQLVAARKQYEPQITALTETIDALEAAHQS